MHEDSGLDLEADIQTFMGSFGQSDVYHAYAVQSASQLTTDGQYWAVDWFWQEPRLVSRDGYYHWILVDVSDPDQWCRCCNVMIRGIRTGEFMGLAHRISRSIHYQRDVWASGGAGASFLG